MIDRILFYVLSASFSLIWKPLKGCDIFVYNYICMYASQGRGAERDLDWANFAVTRYQDLFWAPLRYPTPIRPYFYFEELWLVCQNLSFILKTWFTVGFFEIISRFWNIVYQSMGELYFFHLKHDWGIFFTNPTVNRYMYKKSYSDKICNKKFFHQWIF